MQNWKLSKFSYASILIVSQERSFVLKDVCWAALAPDRRRDYRLRLQHLISGAAFSLLLGWIGWIEQRGTIDNHHMQLVVTWGTIGKSFRDLKIIFQNNLGFSTSSNICWSMEMSSLNCKKSLFWKQILLAQNCYPAAQTFTKPTYESVWRFSRISPTQ